MKKEQNVMRGVETFKKDLELDFKKYKIKKGLKNDKIYKSKI